ncbi:histone deacetylase [Pontibacillus halophilus JSM 076056 = DSM 19796]|uniref:Acetoin utilization protein AcuC n=1 Tax=Pontibacillus halophilus JSM 076056 = DSM 19796 TaxID=1385510 RepID=A0A0A5GE34_9BACI|nr:acetoin utilization protein AcuC [Pontibacillus halophilus]KGX89395.1 histone deacetylase [Pontibacillus halophilus JSM 076056 = DSM 19796]
MSCHAAFVYSEDFTTYKFRDDHPFNQLRVKLTYELLVDAQAIEPHHLLSPRQASDEEIQLIHHPKYVDAVKKASKQLLTEEQAYEFGLGTEDTPMFQNMHEASALLVGGSLSAVDAVLSGKVKHALNLGGGLHHGFERKASGFCIYNDGAIAIEYIRKHYGYKVLYVDTDAHHGDGVQWAFYDDPNVCTLSIHETGRYLFPGTGQVSERGLKEGYGYSYNIPLDAFTEDESFLQAYETALEEIASYFQPDVIITQNGADAHVYDPLTHLCGTMKLYEEIPKLAHSIAHRYCEGRWIALGGGGYDIWRVVPRAWAQIWNVMATNHPMEGRLPEQWLAKWSAQSPVSLPVSWQDPEGICKPIPRQAEINEKNNKVLHKALETIPKHIAPHKSL